MQAKQQSLSSYTNFNQNNSLLGKHASPERKVPEVHGLDPDGTVRAVRSSDGTDTRLPRFGQSLGSLPCRRPSIADFTRLGPDSDGNLPDHWINNSYLLLRDPHRQQTRLRLKRVQIDRC